MLNLPGPKPFFIMDGSSTASQLLSSKLPCAFGEISFFLAPVWTSTGLRFQTPLTASTSSFFNRSSFATTSPFGGSAVGGTSAPASLASLLKNSRLVGERRKMLLPGGLPSGEL